MKCPKCGGNHCHLTISEVTSRSKGYGFGKGCCGYVLMGPLGLLCGLCGGTKTTSSTTELWVCDSCGTKFTSKESERSNVFQEKFYYEHAMEYPEYSESLLVKKFTEIYSKEISTSELAEKIFVRKNENEAFKKQKTLCAECLEKELILFAIEDVSGLIVTMKQIVIEDYYFDLSAIKSIFCQGNTIYVNQYCAKFSTDDLAKKVFYILERTIGCAYNVKFQMIENYRIVLENLQSMFDNSNAAYKSHYSSQIEYKNYIEGLRSEAWERLEKTDNARYKKYNEVKEGKDKAITIFALTDIIFSLVAAINCTIVFDVGRPLLATIFFFAFIGITIGLVLREVYKTVGIDMERFMKDILPKELIDLEREANRKDIERIGEILVLREEEYKNLPGISKLGALPEEDLLRRLKITGKVLIGLAIAGSIWLTVETVMYNRNQSEKESFSESISTTEEDVIANQNTDEVVKQESEVEESIVYTEPVQNSNFHVGEIITTDLFEFTVTNAYVLDYLGEYKKVPEGAVYVAVEYEYKNISKQPISSWSLPSVCLADGNDAVYAQDSDADWYFGGYSDEKLLSDMNPGIKTKGARIFEVAIDVLNAGGMRAYVEADKNFYVDLPLSYDSISDTSYEGGNPGSAKADGYSEEVYGLQTEDVLYAAYGNEDTNIIMELGTYEDGTIGAIFHDGYNIIWQGELHRYANPNGLGLWLYFTAFDGSGVEVEWSSYEAIDFPIVYSAPDALGINGSYGFAYLLE